MKRKFNNDEPDAREKAITNKDFYQPLSEYVEKMMKMILTHVVSAITLHWREIRTY